MPAKTATKTSRSRQETAVPQYPKTGWATAKQTSAFLGIPIRTIYRMIEDDEIANNKARNGEVVRVPWEALHAIKEEAMAKGKKTNQKK